MGQACCGIRRVEVVCVRRPATAAGLLNSIHNGRLGIHGAVDGCVGGQIHAYLQEGYRYGNIDMLRQSVRSIKRKLIYFQVQRIVRGDKLRLIWLSCAARACADLMGENGRPIMQRFPVYGVEPKALESSANVKFPTADRLGSFSENRPEGLIRACINTARRIEFKREARRRAGDRQQGYLSSDRIVQSRKR